MIRSVLGALAGVLLWALITQINGERRAAASDWLDEHIATPVGDVDAFSMAGHFSRRLRSCEYGTPEKWIFGCKEDLKQTVVDPCADLSTRDVPFHCPQVRYEPDPRIELRDALGIPDAVRFALWTVVRSGWLPFVVVAVPSLLLLLYIAWFSIREGEPHRTVLNPYFWVFIFPLGGVVALAVQLLILIIDGVLWAAVFAGMGYAVWNQVKETKGFANFFRRRFAGGGVVRDT